jgi:hypothetical protein
MIKNKQNLSVAMLLLVWAALSFSDRNIPHRLPWFRYEWIAWLLGAAVFFYRSLKVPPPQPREPRRTVPPGKRYAVSVALFCAVALAVPLWIEFYEPTQPIWDGFLAMFLLGLVGCSFAGIRYLQKNNIEVGEARVRAAEHDRGREAE